MSNTDKAGLAARLRNSYRTLDGVVVVSPKLLSEAADALEANAEAAQPQVPSMLVRRGERFDTTNVPSGTSVTFI